ncbi:hypothetical protein D3C71_2145840 [compost metagenome]
MEDVQGRAADLPGIQGLDEIAIDEMWAPGRIDDACAALQLVERIGIEDAACALCQRQEADENFGAFQKRL